MQANKPNGQNRPLVSTQNTASPALIADATHDQDNAPQDRFIKIGDVMDRVGLSMTSIYTFMDRGMFPAKIKLGRSAVWSENAINEWMEDQKSGGEA